MHTYNFYAQDSDRSWDWSNHVFSLGYICSGRGDDPKDAWADARARGDIPADFIEEPDYIRDAGIIAIRDDHEERL